MGSIVVADVVMGLDNILAIAGAARGDYWLIGIGLALSIPIMVAGSLIILRYMERAPWLIYAGGALLILSRRGWGWTTSWRRTRCSGPPTPSGRRWRPPRLGLPARAQCGRNRAGSGTRELRKGGTATAARAGNHEERQSGDDAIFSGATIAHFRNPLALTARPPEAGAVLPDSLLREAADEIAQWPGFAQTPLVALPGFARKCGVGAVYYKDESGRFGLGSFKALGGAYALLRAAGGKTFGAAGGSAGRQTPRPRGRSCGRCRNGRQSRARRRLGRATVRLSVPHFHSRRRQRNRANAMREFGAEIIRIAGDYDESLLQARAEAEKENRILISDFSDDPADITTRRVMAGYAVMSAEARAQMDAPPTHVLLPAGVGGLAAAVIADFWRADPAARPRFVIVESDRADCLYASAVGGGRKTVEIRSETVMAGLSCGEVSAPAWEVVSRGADDFVSIPDELAAPAMRGARFGESGDPSITAGECAVAGWAVLLAAERQSAARNALALDSRSRVY